MRVLGVRTGCVWLPTVDHQLVEINGSQELQLHKRKLREREGRGGRGGEGRGGRRGKVPEQEETRGEHEADTHTPTQDTRQQKLCKVAYIQSTRAFQGKAGSKLNREWLIIYKLATANAMEGVLSHLACKLDG